MKLISLSFICITSISFANQTITIEGGKYLFPSQNLFYYSSDKRDIEIESFMIDKYEVSNKRFGKEIEFEEDKNLPVLKIGYEEARSFCKKNGGDLPTKEQWLIASSFENRIFYPFVTKHYPIIDENNINVIQERAIELEKEGSFGAFNDLVDVENALIGNNGIVGMCANVWEMIKSSGEYVVLKGASFYDSEKYDLMNTQIETKVLKASLREYEHIGFRCVYEK